MPALQAEAGCLDGRCKHLCPGLTLQQACQSAGCEHSALLTDPGFATRLDTAASMSVCAQAESKLVFVPSMSDAGPAAILPRPPLPEPLIADARELLPNAVFASNPCRIRFYNQASHREGCELHACPSRHAPGNGQDAEGAKLRDPAALFTRAGHSLVRLLTGHSFCAGLRRGYELLLHRLIKYWTQ